MAEFTLDGFRVQNKADTYENWINNNPVLGPGEIGFEGDTFRMKIGDGETAYADLPYTNYSEITGLTIDSNSTNPTLLFRLPKGFYVNVVAIKVEEAFADTVSISIGKDDDQTWILDPDWIDLSDVGATYVYKINEITAEETDLKAYITGTRTQGKLSINIK